MENTLAEHTEPYAFIKALSNPGEGVLVLGKGRVVYVNPVACQIFGYTSEEIKALSSFAELIHPDERHQIIETYHHYLAGEPVKSRYQIGGLTKNSERVELEIAVAAMVDMDEAAHNIVVLLDAVGHKQSMHKLEKTLAELERRMFALDQHSIVSVADVYGNILYTNDKFSEISQYSSEDLLGKNHRLLKSGFHPDTFFEEMWQTISQGKVWHGEVKNRKKHGDYYWVSSTIVPFLDASGLPYQYVSIRTDITQQKLHQEELEKARQAAEAGNRAKSEFLSRMSHELRTPLNAILGFAQLLEFDQADRLTLSQREHTEQILKAGWHLLELINETLDLSQIEAGKMKIVFEDILLSELLPQCISLVEPQAISHQIKIIDHITPCQSHVVRADHLRLKQVLINLLANAIKYNKKEGTVTLECLQLPDGKLRISVTDEGAGIPADRLDQLFQPFNRAGAEALCIEGTGIGLSIAKKLVELMGGEIGVTSVKGKGSCFWIELGEVFSDRP